MRLGDTVLIEAVVTDVTWDADAREVFEVEYRHANGCFVLTEVTEPRLLRFDEALAAGDRVDYLGTPAKVVAIDGDWAWIDFLGNGRDVVKLKGLTRVS